jgi:hypothetical protein
MRCNLVLVNVVAMHLVVAFSLIAHGQSETAFEVVSTLTHPKAFDGAHDIEILGDLAFVPGKGGALAVVDVTDPRAPKLLWHRHDPELLFDAETVLPVAGRLYLGTNDFLSIDLANPRAPNVDARLVDRPRISRINGMVMHGHHIFAANKDGYLDLFDVSDPRKPVLAGALNVRERDGIGWPHDVDLAGAHLVVVDPQGFGREGKPGRLALYRVLMDDGTVLPTAEWQLAGVAESSELTGANRVEIKGRHAYVCGSTSLGGAYFTIFDINDPSQPRLLAALPFSDTRGPNGLCVAGSVVFQAGGQTVEAIDVSDPARPMKVAAQRFPNELPTIDDNAHDLVFRNGYLFVTGQSDHCLLVLRVVDVALAAKTVE